MIVVAREALPPQAEMAALLHAHWRELALYQDEVPLDPDWPAYVAKERAGNLVFIGARDDDRLIGYSVFFLHYHIHYKRCRVASNDVIFVDAKHRKGSTVGMRLIRESKSVLEGLGVHRMTWHIKAKSDWSSILLRMGFDLEEKTYGVMLKKEQ